MSLARHVERRLETLVESLAGRVFRGPLHPVELASRLVREADLSVVNTEIGPTAYNDFEIRIGPGEITEELPPHLLPGLAAAVEEQALERGWRLAGPVRVTLLEDPSVSGGTVVCRGGERKGPLPVWATLDGKLGSLELRHNRELVGRSEHADLRIAEGHVSRQHAMIWRDGGGIFIEDFRSANGTRVDGAKIEDPTRLRAGSVVTFGNSSFTFRVR